MKSLLKSFFINLLAFIFAWQYLPSVELVGKFEQILLAAGVLTLLDKFLKPILKILLLPINFLTFGLFSWVITVLVFYLTTEIIQGFVVHDFLFPGFTSDFLIIPETNVVSPLTYVISALFVVIFTKILNWVFKSKVIK
ncbi:hypothetical protein COV24_01790, partial [candidate division WWE3 bacterium CG10_big_fil_rev_8_21_14_0_10_32_10]